MTNHVWNTCFVLCLWLSLHEPADATQGVPSIPVEDYALYDQVVTSKFLTSQTQLVILQRMTASRLLPDQEGPLTIELIDAQGYFSGGLPSDLVRDFVAINQQPGRLEGRFQFGVRYRFVSGETLEEPEVAAAVPATAERGRSAQAPATLDRLVLSRIGRTLRNDQALVYVENPRPDGTGAGFLVWFHRQGRIWKIVDTEVVWTIHGRDIGEGPMVAP